MLGVALCGEVAGATREITRTSIVRHFEDTSVSSTITSRLISILLAQKKSLERRQESREIEGDEQMQLHASYPADLGRTHTAADESSTG